MIRMSMYGIWKQINRLIFVFFSFKAKNEKMENDQKRDEEREALTVRKKGIENAERKSGRKLP